MSEKEKDPLADAIEVEVRKLEAAGLVTIDGDMVTLTEAGRRFAQEFKAAQQAGVAAPVEGEV